MKKRILSVVFSVGMAVIPAFADTGTITKTVTYTVNYDGPAGVADIPVLVRLAANSPEGSGRGRRQVLSRGALPEVTDVSSRTPSCV